MGGQQKEGCVAESGTGRPGLAPSRHSPSSTAAGPVTSTLPVLCTMTHAHGSQAGARSISENAHRAPGTRMWRVAGCQLREQELAKSVRQTGPQPGHRLVPLALECRTPAAPGLGLAEDPQDKDRGHGHLITSHWSGLFYILKCKSDVAPAPALQPSVVTRTKPRSAPCGPTCTPAAVFKHTPNAPQDAGPGELRVTVRLHPFTLKSCAANAPPIKNCNKLDEQESFWGSHFAVGAFYRH